MKKLIAMVLVAVMMIPAAVYACDGTAVLPNIETAAWDVSGCAWVALSAENRLMYGKLSEEEKLEIFPAKSMNGAFVRGITESGVIREKGEMRYMLLEGTVIGLTKVEVTVKIEAEYWEIVESIVNRRMEKYEEITAADIMACTLGRTESTVYHYLFGRTSGYIAVGSVVFNGKNTVSLCVGDWNFDGLADLGFPVYLGNPDSEATEKEEEPETTQEPEPEPAATPEPIVNTVYVKETIVKEVVKETVKEPSCVKIIQNNFQTIVNSTVTNTQKVILNNGGGCRKVECVEK